MRKKYAPVILLSLTSLAIIAAEECHSPNPLAQINQEYFNANTVNEHEDVDDPTTPGTVVIVQTGPSGWQAGTITASQISTNGDAVEVELFVSHQKQVVKRNLMRTIKPLYQLMLKPIPSAAVKHIPIEAFINKFATPENLTPRIIAMLVPWTQRISVCGDLHGQIRSLASIAYATHRYKIIDEDLRLAPDNLFVPLGDYSDRGPAGVEVWYHLAKLNAINGSAVIPLAGNHENLYMAQQNGFLKEWIQKLSPYMHDHRNKLETLFATLPQALLIGFQHPKLPYHRFVLLCHGGIDSSVNVVEAMIQVILQYRTERILPATETIPVNQPEHYRSGFLWSDFFANETVISPPLIGVSDRGPHILTYNAAAAKGYLQTRRIDTTEISCRIDGIICAHRHFPSGLARLKDRIQNGYHWDPITPGETCIIDGNIFTCNACNESCLDRVPSIAEGHFSTLSITPEGNWQITAH